MKNFLQNDEVHFLHLATTYLACRLAAFGGTPLVPEHVPVTNFKTLEYAMLGMHDYAWTMRWLCQEMRKKRVKA